MHSNFQRLCIKATLELLPKGAVHLHGKRLANNDTMGTAPLKPQAQGIQVQHHANNISNIPLALVRTHYLKGSASN